MESKEENANVDKIVEKILDVKYFRGKKQYYVKWKDLESTNNTWEFINPKIENFDEQVVKFENEMKKKKVEAKGSRGGTKTGKWYYVSSSEEEEEIKDKFWLNLDKGKVDLFQSNDMYSGIKDSVRTPKIASTSTEKTRKSGGKLDPLMESDIQISEDYLSETKRVTRSRIQPMIKQKKRRDRIAANMKIQEQNTSQFMPNDEDNDDQNNETADESSIDTSSLTNLPQTGDLFSDEASMESYTDLEDRKLKTSNASKTKNEPASGLDTSKSSVKPKINVDSVDYLEKLKHIDEVIEYVVNESRKWYEQISANKKPISGKKRKSQVNSKKKSNILVNNETHLEGDLIEDGNKINSAIQGGLESELSNKYVDEESLISSAVIKSEYKIQDIQEPGSSMSEIPLNEEIVEKGDANDATKMDVNASNSDNNFQNIKSDSYEHSRDIEEDEEDDALSLPFKKRKSKQEKPSFKSQEVGILEIPVSDDIKSNPGQVKSSKKKKVPTATLR